jgi:hypothetical protein
MTPQLQIVQPGHAPKRRRGRPLAGPRGVSTVTLPAHVFDAYARIAHATRQPLAALLRDILVLHAPRSE